MNNEHTAKTFSKVVAAATLLCLAVALFILTACVKTVHAQGPSSSVAIQAKLIGVFTSQGATASSRIFVDIGAGSNTLFYCNSGFSGTIDLEWSPSAAIGATYFPLATATWATDSLCHQLSVNGYWPNMRSTVTPTAGNLSAWFSSNSGPGGGILPPAVSTNGPTSPVFCDRSSALNIANTATTWLGVQPVNAGDYVVICRMAISFNGATAAGSYSLGWAATNACSSPTGGGLTMYTTASTPQTIGNIEIFQKVAGLFASVGSFPCLTNNSGAAINISFNWASLHS